MKNVFIEFSGVGFHFFFDACNIRARFEEDSLLMNSEPSSSEILEVINVDSGDFRQITHTTRLHQFSNIPSGVTRGG